MGRSCMREETDGSKSSWASNYLVLFFDAVALLEMKTHPFLQWNISEEVLGQFKTITASVNGV